MDAGSLPKLYEVVKIFLHHTSLKADDLKRDPTRFEGSYFEHWADYLNEMAYLEASEGT